MSSSTVVSAFRREWRKNYGVIRNKVDFLQPFRDHPRRRLQRQLRQHPSHPYQHRRRRQRPPHFRASSSWILAAAPPPNTHLLLRRRQHIAATLLSLLHPQHRLTTHFHQQYLESRTNPPPLLLRTTLLPLPPLPILVDKVLEVMKREEGTHPYQMPLPPTRSPLLLHPLQPTPHLLSAENIYYNNSSSSSSNHVISHNRSSNSRRNDVECRRLRSAPLCRKSAPVLPLALSARA